MAMKLRWTRVEAGQEMGSGSFASPAPVAFPTSSLPGYGKPPCGGQQAWGGLPGLGVQQGSPVCMAPKALQGWDLG